MPDTLIVDLMSLPPIGIGCMSLPNSFSESEKIIHHALDSGFAFFDTADLYQKGKNEDNLGRALRGRRDKAILSTKVGNRWNPDGKTWSWNPHKDYILHAVEESMKRLRTDYIDLYQLHGGTLEDPWEEIFEAFELLKSQGKIRAFGISSIRPNVIRKVIATHPPATVMMQYSPLDRRPEEEVFPLLETSSTRVLVRGSLAKGVLIDKPVQGFLDFPAEKVAEIKAGIAQFGYSPEAILLRFGLIEKAVSSLIVGASTPEQVTKLQQGFEESMTVPEEVVKRLKQLFPKNVYHDHR